MNYAFVRQAYCVEAASRTKSGWLRVQCTAFCIHQGMLSLMRASSGPVWASSGQKREANWLLRSIAAASCD